MKNFAMFIGILLGAILAVYLVQSFVIVNAPMQGKVNKAVANAEREGYVATDSYINGKNSELTQFIYEYNTSKDEAVKVALLGRIKESASTVDNSKLSPSVQDFLRSH